MPARKRIKNLYELVMDFLKKCSDDHVGAFGAMSAFFILLSIFPFMIFLLTLTRYIPFSKDDIIVILTRMISFEEGSLIKSIVNEIYRKTGTTVSAISIIAALWSSSRGVYSIVIGLNSVYDIDENRNYFAIRLFSLVYTLLFALMISVMLVMWVFGNSLYSYFLQKFPFVVPILGYFMHKRIIFSLIFLTLLFMIIYKWIPNRVSSFRKQFPGALIATLGWVAVSVGCSIYMDNFTNFSYIYGSMAGIMILLLWLYFCMSMVFYGAEVNYFLENKDNYHLLIRTLRPNWRKQQRAQTEKMRQKSKDERADRKKADAIFIPGCARPEHTEEAARLYKDGYAPLLLPSGGYTKVQGSFQGVSKEGQKYGADFACEADFLEAVLIQNGVPASAILKECEATYTLENAEKTKVLLEKKDIHLKKAILCCKAHHSRRSYLYYSMVFPEIEILVHPVVVDGISREGWYKTAEGRKVVLGEFSRMGQQLLMMEGRIAWD